MNSHDDTQPAAPDWAPRLTKSMISRLYELDAKGLRDDELIEDAGIRLYMRCQSILTATKASRGTVTCPLCEGEFHWQHSLQSDVAGA